MQVSFSILEVEVGPCLNSVRTNIRGKAIGKARNLAAGREIDAKPAGFKARSKEGGLLIANCAVHM
jgi:hypothetical protein